MRGEITCALIMRYSHDQQGETLANDYKCNIFDLTSFPALFYKA